MILSLIVAVAEDGAIGRDNKLPWHLPADLKFFKRTTMGKPVIMGRRTWESIEKPLPGRLNVVVSTQQLKLPEGVQLFDDPWAVLIWLQQQQVDEAFVVGGSKLFSEMMDQMERMYITRIHTKVPDADTFFPHVDHSQWKLVWEEPHEADEKHAFSFVFQQWERISL